MWNYVSLVYKLDKCGFVDMVKFKHGITKDFMFLAPEQDFQFLGSSENYGLCIQVYMPA